MRRYIALSSAALIAGAVLVGLTALPASAQEECPFVEATEVIPYSQTVIEDPNMDAGTSVVDTPGSDGLRELHRCYDDATPESTYLKPVTVTDPTNEVVRVGTRTAPPTGDNTNPPANNNNNSNTPVRPSVTPSPSDTASPTPTPTPTPTRTTPAGQLELDPTYYDVEPPSGQNLLAAGALAGAIIVSCAVILGAIFYRRFFRDRLKYRGR
jgi:hypothetical protein